MNLGTVHPAAPHLYSGQLSIIFLRDILVFPWFFEGSAEENPWSAAALLSLA
jgi:hypothetical protein